MNRVLFGARTGKARRAKEQEAEQALFYRIFSECELERAGLDGAALARMDAQNRKKRLAAAGLNPADYTRYFSAAQK